MIDVSHPASSAFSQHFTHTNQERQHESRENAGRLSKDTPSKVEDDTDEAAWVQSIQSDGLDSIIEVKGLQSGALVMDIGQLRQEPLLSSGKKALKSALR